MTKLAILAFACIFGVMFTARNAVGFLTPDMAPELQLEARHLGLLSAVLAGGWALSGWLLPRVIRPHWNTHTILVMLLVVLALDCIATVFATGFAWLLTCRLLCGIAGGPVLPLIQGVVAHSVQGERRGLHMGLVQGIGGSLIAAILAPLVLVPIAARFGWQMDFILIAVLTMCAALALRMHNMPAPSSQHAALHTHSGAATQHDATDTVAMHSTRNILLCSLIGSLMVTWLVLATTFFPLYLTSIKQVSPEYMSVLMAVIGAGSLCGMILLPYLSDHFGRRLMLTCAAVGALSPAALLMDVTSIYTMSALLFAGSLAGGTFPLFLAIVPSESVPRHKIPSSIGMVQIACELIGGVLAPISAGWLAARHGLQLPVIVALCSAIAAGVLAVGIGVDRR